MKKHDIFTWYILVEAGQLTTINKGFKHVC
nr:MAG TPA: hypothetical protein [Caudoviricetes sp.]